MWNRGWVRSLGKRQTYFLSPSWEQFRFPGLNFCCDLLPLPFMLLSIPQNNSRGKQTAAAADACTEEAATSAGGGESNTEARRDQEGRSFHLFPSPKYPDRQKARGCCLKTGLLFLLLLKVLGLMFLGFFMFFKYRTSVLIQKFLWMLGVGRGSENIHCIFSPGFLVCSYVFQKGTKEKPHWDHNKSSVVLEEMRAYNLDKTRSGRRSMPKNPGTAEWQEHPGASKAVFSSWLGMHVQLQYRSHCASRSPSLGTYNKQPDDSESFTHENTAVRVCLDGDYFFSCTAF